MGKRGYESVEKDPLGSNTVKVLRESQVPILTTKYSRRKMDIRKILAPIDLFEEEKGTNILEYAVDLARLFKARIYLLYVFELNNYHGYTDRFLDRLMAPSVEEIQKFVSEFPSRGVVIEPRVKVAPNAWKGVIDFVEEEGIDLIIIATHGRKGILRFFLGSIAERVIQEAPCPVLSMGPPSDEWVVYKTLLESRS